MSMNNFDPTSLANIPGVTFKKFCSLSCPNEATGTLSVALNEGDELFPMPVCEDCARRALDSQNTTVVD